MSLSTYPAKHIYRAVEPRVDFDEEALYVIGEGGSQISYRYWPATSYSDSNITIPTTQSPDIGIATKVFMSIWFTVTITGTPAPGSTLIQIGQDAPRFMPFNSVLNNAAMTINNSTFTQTINNYFDALMHYNNSPEEYAFDLSAAPSFIDSYQNYEDWQTYGSALNALAQIGESSKLSEPRGGFPFQIISGNAVDGNIAVVQFQTYEPILISPLTWGHHNHKAFIGVNTMNFTFNFDNNIQRVWSRSTLSGATNVTVTATIMNPPKPPQLEFVYITPRATQKIMPIQKYPFNNIQFVSQDQTPVAAGASVKNVAINNITLIGVPARIYIFVRRNNATRNNTVPLLGPSGAGLGWNNTDTFFRIDNINMQFDNQQGILAQATPQQLYLISAENGNKQSWADWSKYQGSIFCCDFSKDIPLNAYSAEGSLKNIQFQYTIDYTNLNLSQTLTPAVYTIISYDGSFVIEASTLTVQETNIVSPSDVINAHELPMLPYHQINTYATSKFGGKTSGVPKHLAKLAVQAYDAYKKLPAPVRAVTQAGIDTVGNYALPGVYNLGKAVAPFVGRVIKHYAGMGHNIAHLAHDMAGRGYTEDEMYEVLEKQGFGRRPHKKSKAGGKRITQADLKRLAY